MMNRAQIVVILVADVLLTAAAFALGDTPETAALYAVWLILILSVAALLTYRMLLTYYDHRAPGLGITNHQPLHKIFARQKSKVDRAGIPLSAVVVVYTAALGLFMTFRFFDMLLRELISIVAVTLG